MQVLKLTTIISLLHEQHYTNPMIGKEIGVTPLQVHYYHTGKTKQPSPIVCKAIYDKFKVDGKPMLVDIYKTYEELEKHYNLVMKHA